MMDFNIFQKINLKKTWYDIDRNQSPMFDCQIKHLYVPQNLPNYNNLKMQRHLTLEYLKDYIPSNNDKITKYRPDCFYVPRPPARRKYETAIRSPDRNFFKLMATLDVYLWIVVKKNLSSDKVMYGKIYDCFKSVKYAALTGYEKLPICETYDECMYWIRNFPSQIVMFEDIFDELFEKLSKQENASGFHIISSQNVEIAKIARGNHKIKNIYDDEVFILQVVKQNMERLAITRQEETKAEEKKTMSVQRVYIRNIIFPNFIKLSKHDKSEHNQYRLHLIGLRKLTTDDKLASKDKFIEFSREKFPDDEELIQQYNTNNFQLSSEILRFYTLDSFFYRVLNNTLRIAKSTEEFFSIGEPFNKVFDAIKYEYDRSKKDEKLVVYRGADLTNSQCQYLEENIGKYIEINGFISTSKKFETAKNFAQQRKNNTIFKIKFSKALEKYKQFDYGYVDLQENKCSAYEEDEVLFNALNVFKIVGKQKQQGFELYVLEYGAIFHILEQDPNKLNENDRFAYYSFKELKQMNEQVKDIGEVYLRTFEPQKAIEIYEFKLEKMKESIEVGKTQQYEETLLKAADAYLANGQPDKALKYYESTFKTKKRKKILIRNSQKSYLQQKQENEIISISTKVTTIQNKTDQFEKAEEQYIETAKQIQKGLKEEWSLDIFWSKITLQWEVAEGKKSQMLFEEQFKVMKQIQGELKQALKKIRGRQNEAYEQKKIQMKLSEVYEIMAQTTSQCETEKSRIEDIKSSFNALYSTMSSVIEKDSYEEGLLNVRRIQIMRRTKNFNEEIQLQNFKRSISVIRNNTTQTDEILPRIYCSLAELHANSQKKSDVTEAIGAYKRQLKIQTLIYSDSDSKPLNTKMNIAIIERDDKNTVAALEQFDEAYHTKLYKSQKKYTTHAKILFNMAQAYTDKGEDGLALKSLKQAYDILEKQLSKKDLEKSVLKFKIKLRMGRIYTSSSLRSPETLKLAEKNLLEYHNFISVFYNHPHTDVGMSYNCLGALYSVLRKFDLSKKKFVKSIEIYSETVGTESSEVAKIKSNLAICYAQLKDMKNATQMLLDSRRIFNKIYTDLRKLNPFEYESKFIQAEIETLGKEYRAAIQSCEKSKEDEKVFLESKKRFNQNLTFLQSEFVPKTSDSFNMKMEMNRPQFNSGIVKFGTGPQKMNSLVAFKQKSENLSLFSYANFITDHGFKCEFQICECLIYLREFKEAKKRLQTLKSNLLDRIQKESINPLFKDNAYSKKNLYLKKSEEYIWKLVKVIEKEEKKGNQPGAKKQNSNEDGLNEMNHDEQVLEHF